MKFIIKKAEVKFVSFAEMGEEKVYHYSPVERFLLTILYVGALVGTVHSIIIYPGENIFNDHRPVTFNGDMNTYIFHFLLLAQFVIQHVGMVQPSFKAMMLSLLGPRIWEIIRRPFYAVASSLSYYVILYNWQEFGPLVFRIPDCFAVPMLCLKLSGMVLWIFCELQVDLSGFIPGFKTIVSGKYTVKPYQWKSTKLYSIVRNPMYLAILFIFTCSRQNFTASYILILGFHDLFTVSSSSIIFVQAF